ncbi:MAG: pentapeptide repeat-containing protein [Vicinamibacterales bacterium]
MSNVPGEDPFTPEGRFKRDPKRQRATFGLLYPSVDLRFTSKAELPRTEQKVLGKRLTFTVERQNLKGVEFEECNFHNNHGLQLSRISHLTFVDCQFRHSIMGTTTYVRCRFRQCTFHRCDFSFADFQDCTFEDCEFVQCTASDAVFERTEIDPDAFMKGLQVPSYNYQNPSPLELDQLRLYVEDVRFRVASRLLRSNSEVSHRFYTDASLRHLKWEELTYRRNRIQWKGFGFLSSRLLGWAFAHIVYFVTSGGTSLLRPIALTALVVAAFSALMPGDCVSYAQVPLEQSGPLHRAMLSTSLVLGFGFTNFSACNTSALSFLVGGACTGIVLLALVASVIVRRVYR